MLHRKHEPYKYVLPLKNWADWITTRREKMPQCQKSKFWKKFVQNLKNIIVSLLTTFYNFDLKIESGWAKKVVKPILETWNAASDVIVYVWFVHSLIKILNNMECKKE